MAYGKFPIGPAKGGYNQYQGYTNPRQDPESVLGPPPKQEDFMMRSPGLGYGVGYGGIGMGSQIPDKVAFNEAMAEYNRKKSNIQQGLNEDGSPIAPEFQSMIDPQTGRLRGGLQLNLGGVEGYDQFRNFATGTGASEFSQAAEDRLGLMTAMERDRATREGAQQAAIARSNLAMRGGLSSGARERIASQGMRAGMAGRQDARQQQLMGIKDIAMQNAAQRQQALGSLVDLGSRAEEFNLGAALDEISAGREAAWRTYEEKGEQWAADKKAAAQRAASGGGCFVAGTLIQMEDGTEKPIEDIQIGDKTAVGGKVYAVYKAAWTRPVYNYGGILVTGEHPVLENGVWKRVEDSESAYISKIQPTMVYDFSNDKHRILIGGVLFTDFAEQDDFSLSYGESIERLNGKAR